MDRTVKKLFQTLLIALSVSALFVAPTFAQATSNAISFYSTTYCNDNTGQTDCSGAFRQWISDGEQQHRALYVPAGTYRLSSSIVVNLHPVGSVGLTILGDGPQLSKFVFDTNVASPNIQFVGNDNSPLKKPADSINYLWIQGLSFRGNVNGTIAQFGLMDFGDALNETQLINDAFYNTSTGSSGVALQLNYFANGFVNAVANSGAPSQSVPPFSGLGFAALDCRQCEFSNFFGSYSIASNGIILRDGFNTANTFHSVDLEVTSVSLNINNSNSVRNTFIGGQYSLATYALYASAGSGNIVENPNFGGNTSNAGPSCVGLAVKFLDTTVYTGSNGVAPCTAN